MTSLLTQSLQLQGFYVTWRFSSGGTPAGLTGSERTPGGSATPLTQLPDRQCWDVSTVLLLYTFTAAHENLSYFADSNKTKSDQQIMMNNYDIILLVKIRLIDPQSTHEYTE